MAGLAALIYGANLLVNGASSIAKKFGIRPIVIGLTIVAFGTSAPELVVNILAAWRGATDIAIGNIIGSNIVNILLILGVAALISPLKVQRNTTWKEIPLAFLAAVIAAVMVNDKRLDGLGFSALTRTDGLTLIAFFIIFLYYTYGISKAEGEPGEEIKTYPVWKSSAMVLGGLALLMAGGKLIVDSSVSIARGFGVSEALIGLTIVAVGTSLPELATSVVAAYKKQVDIAVGNVVGSNIFNIFWILGVSSIIRPLPFMQGLGFDLGVNVLATFLLFLFMFVGRKNTLHRWEGGAFVVIYIVYIVFLIQRG